MKHFGILCPPVPGHLYSLMAIGKILRQRGHRVTVFTLPDARELVEEAGLEVALVGEADFPAGRFREIWAPLSRGRGWRVTLQTAKLKRALADIFCGEVPGRARELRIEALVIDQGLFYGFAIAEGLGVPFYSVASAIHFPFSRDLDYPPPGARWGSKPGSILRQLGNAVLYRALELWAREQIERGNRVARANGTWERRSLAESFSSELVLSQIPRVLDYPSRAGGPLRHLGPYRLLAEPRERRDTGERLVFCSFGTLQNGLLEAYEAVLGAAKEFPQVRFLVSRGSWAGSTMEPLRAPVPENVEVIAFADQPEVLSRASVMINHGGTNSVCECVYFGVPMICIPVTNDQPFLARRVRDRGLGLVLPLRSLSSESLARALRELLEPGRTQENLREAASSTRQDMTDQSWLDILER